MKGLHMLLRLVLLGTTAAQGKAYRDINFGDPFEVVTQKVLEDEHFRNQFDHPIRVDTTVPERVLELQTQYLSIAGTRYQIRFHFYDEKLFRLRFFSDDYTANYFPTHPRNVTSRSPRRCDHGGSGTTHSYPQCVVLRHGQRLHPVDAHLGAIERWNGAPNRPR